jgi:hypothetical protein
MRRDLTHQDSTPRVYVIHENDAWVIPLRKEFDARAIPFSEWHLDQGVLDLRIAPPPGIFYNRMSASSHTRDHRYAPELTAAVLAWLKHHGRTVVNGERALQLELSKVAQYEALDQFGVETPETLAGVGKRCITDAARRLGFPLIMKHNRAGKGLGVRLFLSDAALDEHLAGDDFEESVDGITLIQRYIKASAPFITRVEFVGGKLLYAVRVDTSQGFELCPADACRVDLSTVAEVCPAVAPGDKFQIVPNFDDPLVARAGRRSSPPTTSASPVSNSSSMKAAAHSLTTSTPTLTITRRPKPRTGATTPHAAASWVEWARLQLILATCWRARTGLSTSLF